MRYLDGLLESEVVWDSDVGYGDGVEIDDVDTGDEQEEEVDDDVNEHKRSSKSKATSPCRTPSKSTRTPKKARLVQSVSKRRQRRCTR